MSWAGMRGAGSASPRCPCLTSDQTPNGTFSNAGPTRQLPSRPSKKPPLQIPQTKQISTQDHTPQQPGKERETHPRISSHGAAAMASTAATTYRCTACGADLNLSAAHLYPAGAYFEAGNKGTLSFSWVDESRLRFAEEDRIRPFFETVDYWGIQRRRTRISCDACGCLLGYVYDDGPPVMQGTGQFGMGPSQVIPRRPRYRIKIKAVTVTGAPDSATAAAH